MALIFNESDIPNIGLLLCLKSVRTVNQAWGSDSRPLDQWSGMLAREVLHRISIKIYCQQDPTKFSIRAELIM